MTTIEKPRVRVRTDGTMTRDSFQNFAARLGIGTNNVSTAASYGFNPISRNRVQLEWMYRGSWLVGQAVDVVAEDMTSAGIDYESVISPKDIGVLKTEMNRLGAWTALCETIKWARLYGGAIAVLLVDGQDNSSPLRLEAIGRDQFKGLLVLDRWMVTPSLSDVVQELGPHLGKPKFYEITVDAPALHRQKIHYSRVVRFEGVDLPYWQRIAENGWGLSVVERLYDRLTAFDSTSAGAAQLTYKAHLRTVKVKNLRTILAAGGEAEKALMRQFEMIRLMQSNEGLTLLDADDEFQTHQYSFTGLSDVMLQFGQQISGALRIPLVRLFGQSPAGLNSTGDSDLRTYYDGIHTEQERRERDPIQTIAQLTFRSKFGSAPPEGFDFKFNPLWQLSDTDKATVTTGVTNAIVTATAEGIIKRATALKELKQSSDVTGVFSNISDEEIKEAEQDPPVPGESDLPPPPKPEATEPDDVHPLPAADA
ncbi:DUF1073 domain-containing protein [Labrys neptuniae]